jgi:DNA-nicking Smr family endonuclease
VRPKPKAPITDSEADEDTELFRKTVGPVKPLRQDPHVPAASRRRPGRARYTRQDRLAVLGESLTAVIDDPLTVSGEELSHRRPGVPENVLRKLRRGEYRVQGELDLHGLTVAQAQNALRDFLADALERQAGCVRIIHGKGLRSGHRGPVLKGTVSAVLRRTSAVVAYVSARPIDGGTGAVYVLLSNKH